MKTKNQRRVLSLVLCALMLCCLLSFAVSAEEKTPLTVTTKEQTFDAGEIPSSTLNDVTVEGLLEGHSVESVTLTMGDHTVELGAIVIKQGDTDVTAQYQIAVVKGACHIISSEWADDGANHYRYCSDNDCTLKLDTAAHSYDNACDAGCNICTSIRQTADHVYGEGTVLSRPTRKGEGKTEYVCSVCGYHHIELTPAKGGLPVGAIVAIVVGAVAVACVAGFAIFKVVSAKKAVGEAVEADEAEKTE